MYSLEIVHLVPVLRSSFFIYNKALLHNCYLLFYYKPLVLECIYTEFSLAHFCPYKNNCEMRQVELQTWTTSEIYLCVFKHHFIKVQFTSQHWTYPWAFASDPSQSAGLWFQAQRQITSFLEASRNLWSPCPWEEGHQEDSWVPCPAVSPEDCFYSRTPTPGSHLIKAWACACYTSGKAEWTHQQPPPAVLAGLVWVYVKLVSWGQTADGQCSS